jgi:hypothetical protein
MTVIHKIDNGRTNSENTSGMIKKSIDDLNKNFETRRIKRLESRQDVRPIDSKTKKKIFKNFRKPVPKNIQLR